MKKSFLSFVIIISCCFSSHLLEAREHFSQFITLEKPAISNWGLMQRSYIPDNYGMFFRINPGTRMWMFNCLIDLSLAFLDKNGVILELHEMRAYPEKMDPQRPVRSPSDFSKYSTNDPIFLFFISRAVAAPPNTMYAIEMRKNWFQEKNIQVGDRMIWNKRRTHSLSTIEAEIRHY